MGIQRVLMREPEVTLWSGKFKRSRSITKVKGEINGN